MIVPSFAAGAASSAVAAEGPSVAVSVQNTINIYTATPASSNVAGFKPHINFPSLKNRADGSLDVDFSVGQTHGSGAFGVDAYSSDGGLTWNGVTTAGPSTPNEQLIKPVGQTSYGISSSMATASGTTNWVNTLYTSTNGGTTWAYSNATFNTGGVSYVSAYNDFTDLAQYGSTLLGTMYAQRLGQSTYESVLFASTDNGVHWNRRSTIANYTSDPNVQMGPEGPTEASILQLNNGNLLSVFRTGQVFPASNVNSFTPTICMAVSSDQGVTWSAPKQLGVAGDFPQLRKLDDGTVAMSYGRYGAKVMFADSTGTRWSTPTVIYNGPGSGYVDMRKTANGSYCFVYDQSSFYPPSYNGAPPNAYVYNNDQSANLKAAILTITPQPTTDDYHWANQYHGDFAPESLAQPWTKGQVGSVTTNQWAEAGQDYIRVSTGGTGSNLLYYQMGAGTPWQNMHFDQGTVVDVRARCGLSSAEGAGDVLIDDGVNGYAVLQYTGQGLTLEGLGGNAGQVSYLAADHAGFNSFDWHNCRVVVEPDASAGGALYAKVYLDGNFSTPILSKLLAPSTGSVIRFGDETGVNNGNLDLDYLRFSLIIGQWNQDTDGQWDSFDNWSTAVPQGADRTANFTGAIGSPCSVTLSQPTTVGHINFDNTNAYTIAGSALLTLQVTGGNASVTVSHGSHTIATPVVMQSNTNFDVAADSVLVLSGALTAAPGVVLNKVGAGTLQVRNVRANALNVQSGAVRISADGSSAGLSVVGSLSVAGGAKLDLIDNDLIIHSGDVGSWNGANYTAIAGLIQSGRNGGAPAAGNWAGSGIVTSQATAISSNLTSLGVATAAQVKGIAATDTAIWSGQMVSGSDVLVMYTYGGDANLDGKINVDDYTRIDFNAALGTSGWFNGDFNYDGKINVDDYTIIDFNVGIQGAPLGSADSSLDLVAIPEPAMGILALGICFQRRRRSKR